MGKTIFLTGVGRSGTTLLQSMLNAHPDICFTPETHFIKNYIVPSLSGRKKYNRESLLAQLKSDKDIARLNLDIESSLPTGEISTESLTDYFFGLFTNYVKMQNKTHLGDKDPMNAPFIPHIKKVYPEAYLIHIIRDPRDVILSRMKADWGKDTAFFMHVTEYQSHLRKALSDGKKNFGDKYIEVFYEKLLASPEEELKRICSQLGVGYSTEMMNYHQKSADIVFGDEKSWKENVFKPVMKDNTEKWRKELSATQVAKIEGGIEDLMTQLGYELSTKGMWFQKKLLSLPIKLATLAYKMKSDKNSIH